MQEKFKIGDTLEVVNTEGPSGTYLAMGQIVTVIEVHRHDMVHVMNMEGTIIADSDSDKALFCMYRFKKVVAVPPIDWCAPLETQDGKEFTLLTTKARGEYPVRGYIGNDGVVLTAFTITGKYYINSTTPDKRDLRNSKPKPKQVVSYVNIYSSGNSGGYPTRHAADLTASFNRLACIRVTALEGQFDE